MDTPVRLFEGRFGRLMLLDVSGEASEREATDSSVLIKHTGPSCEVLSNGERIGLSREHVMVLGAGTRYALAPCSAEAPTRVVLFQASFEWLNEVCPALGASLRVTARRVDVTRRIRQLADTMAIEALNDQFLSVERLEFMLQELVLSMLDSYFGRRAAGAIWRGSRFEDSRIRRAIALLRARPNKELNIDALASRVGLSRSRFYHLFQVCTGRSPRDYLDMLCVETAISRLAASNARIADVSSGLGFSAQSNFTRFFLNQVGVPPSQYRRVAGASAPAVDAGPPGEPEPAPQN